MATLDSSGGRHELSGPAPAVVAVSESGPVVFPDGFLLAGATMARVGSDLVATDPDGVQVIVRDYFLVQPPADLAGVGGAQIPGVLAANLAEQRAPGQYAQAGSPAASGEPIGEVQQVEGLVVAIRADGTRIELQAGDPVYQGDVLESGADGAIGVLLADDTSFSMAANGRMVLDEMIYDPNTQEGSIGLSVVQGVFSFVSGQIAKSDPDAMTVDTPVATIGIRGTQLGVDIRDGLNLNVTLMEESDGFVGEVVVLNDGGVAVLNGAYEFTVVSGFGLGPSAILETSIQEMLSRFAGSLRSLPVHQGNENTYGLRDGEPGEGLEDLLEFNTEAGGESVDAGTNFGGDSGLGGVVRVVEGDYTQPGQGLGNQPLTTPASFAAGSSGPESEENDDGEGAPLGEAAAAGNIAPFLEANAGITVDVGEDAGIGSNVLSVADPDDPANQIVFTIVDDPDHGTLYLGETALGEGSQFTQFDIDNGLLAYEADEAEPFTYEWSDTTPEWADGGEIVNQADLTLPEGGESVTVTFEGEDAGYHNAIGWYKLDADGKPTDPQFIWGDASVDGDTLPSGSVVTLEGLEPGQEFGLFIVQDGARGYRWLPDLVDADAQFSFDAAGNLVGGNSAISANRIFFSGDAALNPDGVNHARAGTDGDSLMIGFEDKSGGGDTDYNDLIVSIRYEGAPQAPDSDSFRFVVTDGTDQLADTSDEGEGYTVTDGEGTFSITIDSGIQAA